MTADSGNQNSVEISMLHPLSAIKVDEGVDLAVFTAGSNWDRGSIGFQHCGNRSRGLTLEMAGN